jgi:hypothetical protein
VESRAPGRLAKANETQRFQPFAHFAGCFDHGRESHIGPWIEIEYETTRHLRSLWLAVPRVQLQGAICATASICR